MEPSSRTPEGEPNRCPVCGKTVQIDPSRPPGDAPCPHCGHLLWFGPQEQHVEERKPVEQKSRFSEQIELAQQRLEELVQQEPRLLRQGDFTLVDFRKMVVRMRNQMRNQRPVNKVLGIIDAMTPEERRNPKDILNEGRRSRVAKGAGVTPGDVSNLVNQFDPMAQWIKRISGMSVIERMREIPNA